MKLTWDLRSGQAGSGRPWNSLTSKTGPLEEWQASKRPLRQEWDDVWGVVRLSSDPYKCSHPRCVSLHTCMHARAQTYTHTATMVFSGQTAALPAFSPPYNLEEKEVATLPPYRSRSRSWVLLPSHLTWQCPLPLEESLTDNNGGRAHWPNPQNCIQEPLSFRRFTRWKGRLSRLDFLFIAN